MFLKEAFRVQKKINNLISYSADENLFCVMRERNYTKTLVTYKKSELNKVLPNENYNFKDEEKETTQDKRFAPDYKTVIKTICELIALKTYLSTQIEKAKATILINDVLPYDTALMKANMLRSIIAGTDSFRDESEKSVETKDSITLITKDGSITLSYPMETKIIPNIDAFKSFREMKNEIKARAEELSSLIEAAAFSTKVEISEEKQELIDKVMKADTFVELF